MTALIGGPTPRPIGGRLPIGPFPQGPLLARTLGEGEVAVIAATLDEIPSAAYVVWGDGAVAFANDPGAEEFGRAPEEIGRQLVASLKGHGDSFHVKRIAVAGAPSHFLAVRRGGPADTDTRVRVAAGSLEATPRQAEVLSLLVRGRSNKAIAAELGCAEATVEIHVGVLLKKSGCGSRCELVSQFWSGPMHRNHRHPDRSVRVMA
jgi:DNA-binding CsgD family transcriptional regulator